MNVTASIEFTPTAAERDAWDLAEARRREIEAEERRSTEFLEHFRAASTTDVLPLPRV